MTFSPWSVWKRNWAWAEPSTMIHCFGSGAFSYCARIPGSLGPSSLASSRATINSERALSFSAGPFGDAPRTPDDQSHPAQNGSMHPLPPATHTAPYHRHRLRARFPQIEDSGQHVEVQRSTQGVRLAGTTRLTIATEVDSQYTKPGGLQNDRLLFPALFVELPAVGKHNGSVALSVYVAVDDAPILCRKRDGLLRKRRSL